jgi:hypothetical protein
VQRPTIKFVASTTEQLDLSVTAAQGNDPAFTVCRLADEHDPRFQGYAPVQVLDIVVYQAASEATGGC